MTTFKASASHLKISALPTGTASIDIYFDDNRVWSVDTRALGSGVELSWPEALKEHLSGSTLLSIKPSGQVEALVSEEVTFSDDGTRTAVVDDSGFYLSVNKWGRLGRSLEAISDDFQTEIIRRAAEIIEVLEKEQLRPFVVGGTLLGAVREQKLLSHDDDADIAYLSEHTNPADVAVEGYRVGRRLAGRGYNFTRHSATHMQLHFVHEASGAPYYIDVFSAFFTEDGFINQPFHVRGKMSAAEMLPFSEVKLGESAFPAPANTDRWLTINYDKDWRTPIPGFDLGTPAATNRRFFNWFGSFNHNREFWNDHYSAAVSAAVKDPRPRNTVWQAGANFIKQTAKTNALISPHLVVLGCGDGKLAAALASPDRKVLATDYADVPLKLATDRLTADQQATNITVAMVNLFRLNAVVAIADAGVTGPFDVVANHLLEQTVREAREGAYRLFCHALKSGGSAIATFFSRPDPAVHPGDPTLWHLGPHVIAQEAAKFGLGTHFEPIDTEDRYTKSRSPIAVTFNLFAETSGVVKENQSLKQRIARLLDSIKPGGAREEIADLKAEVEQLRAELDEYRALSSRVAQLTDIIETKAFAPDKDV